MTRVRLDDGECERWTRATKGKDEPLPSADLRYAACAVARGYADGYKRDRALECLTTRGYTVVDIPPMVDRPDPMRPTR